MENKYKLSLCMIVKDCAEHLPTLWASVKRVVDDWVVIDTGSSDMTAQVARDLGAKVFEEGDRFCDIITKDMVGFYKENGIEVKEGEKVFHFGKARTFSFAQATGDFILWLDSDDVLQGSSRLRELIENNLDPKKNLGLHLLYQYEVDQTGTPLIEHYRERVFPNNGKFNWVGRIHEIIIPEVETQYIRVAPSDVKILHTIDEDHRKSSFVRNVRNSLFDLYEQERDKNVDPRTLYYLAEALRHSNPDMAKKYYEDYVALSGWDEEQALACTKIADILLRKEDNHGALKWAYEALRYKPDFPMCYATIAECYYALEDYPNCELFCKHALELDQPETLVMVNQKHNQFTPLLLLVMSYFKKGALNECKKYLGRALEYEPQNGLLIRIASICQQVDEENKAVNDLKSLADFMKEDGEILKLKNILKNLPSAIVDDPRVKQLKKETFDRIHTDSEPLELNKEQIVMFARALANRGAKTFHQIGMGPKSVDLFKKLEFEQAKDDDKADAVFLVGNLDCVEDPKGFLTTAAQGLKPQGRIFVMTNPDKIQRLQTFSTRTLDELATQSGMTCWNLFPIEESIFAEILPGKLSGKRAISFICGEGFEEWGPLSIQSGIGGSEEAVIYLSRELAFLGHPVTVYNSLSQYVVHEGVKWEHYTKLVHERKHDLAVLWRGPHYITDFQLEAKDFYVWLHDVPQKHWWTDERVSKISKIFALSEYHKTLVPAELQSKVVVTQNGLNVSQFNKKVERKPRRLIYTSAYDRGLEHLLNIMPDIVKKFPDVEAHIYYGWKTFDALRKDEQHLQWKSEMIRKMEAIPNVFEHGRIGQEELAEEFLKSDIYVYPCHFEEISCISAMKAQVAGCIPLTTDYSALAETNLVNITKIPGNAKDPKVLEEFKTALLGLLEEPLEEAEREPIKRNARNKFDWFNVAKQWSTIFQGGNTK